MNNNESAVSNKIVSQCEECANNSICKNNSLVANPDMPSYIVVKCRNFKEVERPQEDCSNCAEREVCGIKDGESPEVAFIRGNTLESSLKDLIRTVKGKSRHGDKVVLSAHPSMWHTYMSEYPEYFKQEPESGNNYLIEDNKVVAHIILEPSLSIGIMECHIVRKEEAIEEFDIDREDMPPVGVLCTEGNCLGNNEVVSMLVGWNMIAPGSVFVVNPKTNENLAKNIPFMWDSLQTGINSDIEEGDILIVAPIKK